MIPLVAAAVMIGTMIAVPAADAQTPFGGKGQPVPPTPPGKAVTPPAPASPQSAPPTASVTVQPARPISPDMKQQAEYQVEGVFPKMDRPGAGGQVQDAWNDSDPRAGVYIQRLCEDCVYKVRTREFMSTTVILPEDAVITSIEPGDDRGFTVKPKASNKLAIRPSSWGMDTNVTVFTKSGAVYPLYVRSETVNSMNLPDLVVKIVGREKPASIEVPAVEQTHDPKDDPGKTGKPDAQPKKVDFVRRMPVDPAKFRGWGDYKLWGDEELKPETVWRDDIFTYIRYGQRWDGMELSTGYVTIDGIDELVNSRVEGSVFVIESTSPLITLKNGQKFLCIRYTGDR